jgi:hypothetical protein
MSIPHFRTYHFAEVTLAALSTGFLNVSISDDRPGRSAEVPLTT